MAGDDAFDGTTYIHHGKDHAVPQPNQADATQIKSEQPMPPAAQKADADELRERLNTLEQEFDTFKKQVEKKLKAIEKIAESRTTPAERVYSIQEDS